MKGPRSVKTYHRIRGKRTGSTFVIINISAKVIIACGIYVDRPEMLVSVGVCMVTMCFLPLIFI
jgi:uncharacterized membrane-anchored protein YitT (DUF2179 family)